MEDDDMYRRISMKTGESKDAARPEYVRACRWPWWWAELEHVHPKGQARA